MRSAIAAALLLWSCAVNAQSPPQRIAVLGTPKQCSNIATSLAGNILTGPNFTTGWTGSNATIVAPNTAFPAPDCTNTAASLTEDVTANAHLGTQTVTVSASTTLNLSMYGKRKVGGPRNMELFVFASGFGSGFNGVIDLGSGAVNCNPGGFGAGFTGVSCTSRSAGNGWWYLQITFTTAIGTTSVIINSPTAVLGNVDATYTGDGGSGIYMWNAWLR